jgi:hypothetical protein
MAPCFAFELKLNTKGYKFDKESCGTLQTKALASKKQQTLHKNL